MAGRRTPAGGWRHVRSTAGQHRDPRRRGHHPGDGLRDAACREARLDVRCGPPVPVDHRQPHAAPDLRVLQRGPPCRAGAADARLRPADPDDRHPPDPAHHPAWRGSHGGRVALCPPPAGSRPAAEPGMSGDGGHGMETGHILVVDDNEMNRDMLARRLQRQGHTIEMAIHGRDALAKLEAGEYDLVLLDIMMPEMNGYELLEHLRGTEQFRHLPVILISALDDTDSVVKGIQIGADDHLPKPFNPHIL